MNRYGYLTQLKQERQALKKELAYVQPRKHRDFLFKRLMKVSIEIERVKNENRNTNLPSYKEKSSTNCND